MISFINRKQMYFFERIYRYASVPIVKGLAKTDITPNMVTITNFILSFFNTYLLFNNKASFISAFLILVYYFLDVVDGNLARFTGKTSKLGARLDDIGDGLFYNIFIIVVGLGNVSFEILLTLLIIHNFYSFITTNYIVPNIRRIKVFKRIGIKKWLMAHGVILGVDLSLIGILLACAIVSKQYVFVYKLIIILYLLDIIYRFTELWINKYLDKNN